MTDEGVDVIDLPPNWAEIALEWAAHRRALRSMADLTDDEREEWSFIQAELELRKARDQYESNRRWYSRTVREPKDDGVRLSRTPREIWTSRIRKLLGQRRHNGTPSNRAQDR